MYCCNKQCLATELPECKLQLLVPISFNIRSFFMLWRTPDLLLELKTSLFSAAFKHYFSNSFFLWSCWCCSALLCHMSHPNIIRFVQVALCKYNCIMNRWKCLQWTRSSQKQATFLQFLIYWTWKHVSSWFFV